MRRRCGNPKDAHFKYYGGRGIRVCERWQHSFAAFFADMSPSWLRGLTLDRIHNDGHYEPGNCRWATAVQQSRNKRSNVIVQTAQGEMCEADAAKLSGLTYAAFRKRLRADRVEGYRLLAPPRPPRGSRHFMSGDAIGAYLASSEYLDDVAAGMLEPAE